MGSARSHSASRVQSDSSALEGDRSAVSSPLRALQPDSAPLEGGLSLDNPYGGFYFYSSHLIEIALTIFGYDPVAVNAVRTKAGIAAVLEYAGYAVTLNYTESAYKYGGVVLARGGVSGREINMGDAYAREAESFVKMLRTGESDIPARNLALPVRVLNAIEASYTAHSRQCL